MRKFYIFKNITYLYLPWQPVTFGSRFIKTFGSKMTQGITSLIYNIYLYKNPILPSLFFISPLPVFFFNIKGIPSIITCWYVDKKVIPVIVPGVLLLQRPISVHRTSSIRPNQEHNPAHRWREKTHRSSQLQKTYALNI